MATKIQLRGDTLENWLKADPVLADREVALVATSSDYPKVYDAKKVGDGIRKFSELTLQGYECLQDLGDSMYFPMSQAGITTAILNKIDLSAIDFNPGTLVKLAMCQVPTRFNVVKNNKVCGTMEVFSDDMGHMVTEVFETHYTLVDGELGTTHLDDKIFRYMRSYHYHGGTSDIPVGTWGEWKTIYSSDNADKIKVLEDRNVALSEDEYEALETKDESKFYFIYED